MNKDIKYLVISDIHLGNERNTTKEIIANLDTYFDNYNPTSQFADLDILFIAGDLYDKLLDFSSDDIHEITLWLSRVVKFCSRNSIKLRILEGTPSHDWQQSRIIETLDSLLTVKTDIRYISTIHIEYLKDLGIHILYVPDEATSSAELTFTIVKKLMAELKIEQVDIAIMHGMFDYQATWIK